MSFNFISHLEELRKRLLIFLASFVAGTVLSYVFSHTLIDVLITPLRRYEEAQLIFQTPYEAFLTHLKVSALGGLLLSAPVFFSQLWLFISPGLYEKEKKTVLPLITVSVILALAGTAFAYFVVIPFALRFLMSFQTESLRPLLAIGPYFSFLVSMLFAFAVVFDFPVIIFGMIRLGVVKPEALTRARKIVVLGIFIGAAVLTPPDPVSQLLLALPLIVLFEVTLFIAKRSVRRSKRLGQFH